MARLYHEDGLRERLAAGALARFKSEYSDESMVARYRELYLDLAARKGLSAAN